MELNHLTTLVRFVMGFLIIELFLSAQLVTQLHPYPLISQLQVSVIILCR